MSIDSNDSPASHGIEVAPGVHLPESALRFSSTRSAGPGGQHVNKVATKIRLHVSLNELRGPLGEAAARRLERLAGSRLTREGDIVITSQQTRSVARNRQDCLSRLRELLVQAMRRPRPRRPTKPSAASKRRRLEAKQHRARIKGWRRKPNNE